MRLNFQYEHEFTGHVTTSSLSIMTVAEWDKSPEKSSPLWRPIFHDGLVYALAVELATLATADADSVLRMSHN